MVTARMSTGVQQASQPQSRCSKAAQELPHPACPPPRWSGTSPPPRAAAAATVALQNQRTSAQTNCLWKLICSSAVLIQVSTQLTVSLSGIRNFPTFDWLLHLEGGVPINADMSTIFERESLSLRSLSSLDEQREKKQVLRLYFRLSCHVRTFVNQ